jgi:putative protease
MEKELGRVTHYFDKAMVAVIRLNDKLAIGDTVKFVHGENEFTQTIDSMEVEHKKIQSGKAGEEVAVKVSEKTHEGAKVYKVE